MLVLGWIASGEGAAPGARLYFVIDLALLSGFYLIGLTGLIISTWLGLELGNYAAWRDLHVWVSIATLALVVLKIGLHQGWIITTARRYFGGRKAAGREPVLPVRPPASLEHTQLVAVPARSVAAPVNTSRRDFLLLMGTVGAAANTSTIGVLHDPAAAAGTVAADDENLTSLVESGSQSITSQSASSSSSRFVGRRSDRERSDHMSLMTCFVRIAGLYNASAVVVLLTPSQS